MSKTTYFTTGAIATVLILLLDSSTGQSFFHGPIAMIYVGFLLCLVVLYFVINGHSNYKLSKVEQFSQVRDVEKKAQPLTLIS